MKILHTHLNGLRFGISIFMALSAMLPSINAQASLLNPSSGGTFTMNLDRNALAPYYGYFLSSFWNSAASDVNNPINTGNYLVDKIAVNEISGINRVFDLTDIGNNPNHQPDQRFVKGTSVDFAIDPITFSGMPGTQIGMTGVQGFYAPFFPRSDGGLGGGVVNGDFSVVYDSNRREGNQTGWYLANHIYFTMAVYDLSHLSIEYTDSNDWRLSGDLLMSPENGDMLQGATLNDVGDFCLGLGSYAGCGQVSEVPLPGALALFTSGLLGFLGVIRRKIPH